MVRAQHCVDLWPVVEQALEAIRFARPVERSAILNFFAAQEPALARRRELALRGRGA